MKTPEQLKAAWESLPESATFARHFSSPLYDIEQADSEITKLQRAIASWQAEKDAAVATLNERVKAAAMKDWTPAQVKEAGL